MLLFEFWREVRFVYRTCTSRSQGPYSYSKSPRRAGAQLTRRKSTKNIRKSRLENPQHANIATSKRVAEGHHGWERESVSCELTVSRATMVPYCKASRGAVRPTNRIAPRVPASRGLRLARQFATHGPTRRHADQRDDFTKAVGVKKLMVKVIVENDRGERLKVELSRNHPACSLLHGVGLGSHSVRRNTSPPRWRFRPGTIHRFT